MTHRQIFCHQPQPSSSWREGKFRVQTGVYRPWGLGPIGRQDVEGNAWEEKGPQRRARTSWGHVKVSRSNINSGPHFHPRWTMRDSYEVRILF